MKKLRDPNGENRRLLLYKRLPWSQQPPVCGEMKVWVHSEPALDTLSFSLTQEIDGIQCSWRMRHGEVYLAQRLPAAELRQLQILGTKYENPYSINMFSAASSTMAQWLLLEWSQQDWEKVVREEWEKRLTREAQKGTVTP